MSWSASLSLDYQRRGERTVLQHQHQGPLRVFRSLYPEGPSVCHNILIHPPGGLVSGDEVDIAVQCGEHSHALVSTPGATRFYRSNGEAATQHIRLQLQAGARLEWLPLETLVYQGSHAINRLEFVLAPDAELIAWDVLALGLPASGQPFESGHIRSSMAWPGVWRDEGHIDGSDVRWRNSPLGLDGQSCLGTLVLACGDAIDTERREGLLDTTRELIDSSPLRQRAGATAPNDHLIVVRALADQVEPLMQLWQHIWALWRRQAWHMDSPIPRIWRV